VGPRAGLDRGYRKTYFASARDQTLIALSSTYSDTTLTELHRLPDRDQQSYQFSPLSGRDTNRILQEFNVKALCQIFKEVGDTTKPVSMIQSLTRKTCQPFIAPEVTLPYSKFLAIGLHSESAKISPHPHTYTVTSKN
jgi:hypothetical protein